MSALPTLFVACDGAIAAGDAASDTSSMKLQTQALPCLLQLQRAGVKLVLVRSASQATARRTDIVRDLCISQGVSFARELALPTVSSQSIAAAIDSADAAIVVGDAAASDAATPDTRTYVLGSGANALSWPAIVADLLARTARIDRGTKETTITGSVNLDATGPTRIATGIGFFDHMLEQLSRHGGFALDLECRGDLQVDEHHTVEDCALAVGDALRRALGAKLGIQRYGFLLAMDEAEAQVAIDLSGRAYFVFDGKFGRESVGGLPTELVPHFFRSLADSIGAAIHISVRGENSHHMVESCFKGVGRALRQAFRREGDELPSTKGVL
jgi:imidazoleglycerol-phosphate dehydratase/histidinol-phosphatase